MIWKLFGIVEKDKIDMKFDWDNDGVADTTLVVEGRKRLLVVLGAFYMLGLLSGYGLLHIL